MISAEHLCVCRLGRLLPVQWAELCWRMCLHGWSSGRSGSTSRTTCTASIDSSHETGDRTSRFHPNQPEVAVTDMAPSSSSSSQPHVHLPSTPSPSLFLPFEHSVLVSQPHLKYRSAASICVMQHDQQGGLAECMNCRDGICRDQLCVPTAYAAFAKVRKQGEYSSCKTGM